MGAFHIYYCNKTTKQRIECKNGEMSVITGINEICFDACINAAETTLMQTPPDFN